jgi:hypothetical protein
MNTRVRIFAIAIIIFFGTCSQNMLGIPMLFTEEDVNLIQQQLLDENFSEEEGTMLYKIKSYLHEYNLNPDVYMYDDPQSLKECLSDLAKISWANFYVFTRTTQN